MLNGLDLKILMTNRIGSRQFQILELLLKNKIGLSIDEIASMLDISRNAVQQHFLTLEKEGYIETAELKKTAGRPVRTFVLTESGINRFPKQYAWFSELIVSELENELGAEYLKSYFQKMGINLSQTLISQFEGKSTEQRLELLLNVMDDLGFQASEIKSENNNEYRIKAYNCIYHDLAQKYEAVCELDKTLISTLLNKDVELVECMAKGGHSCHFKIKDS